MRSGNSLLAFAFRVVTLLCRQGGGRHGGGSAREARNAKRAGAFADGATGGGTVELAVGGSLLAMTCRAEHVLRVDNGLLVEDFAHLSLVQPRWMTKQGIAPGATHHHLPSLAGVDATAVEGACMWRAGATIPIDPARFVKRPRRARDDETDEAESESDRAWRATSAHAGVPVRV